MNRIILVGVALGWAVFSAHAQLHVTMLGADPIFSTPELDVMRPLPRRVSIGLPWVYLGASGNVPNLDTFIVYSSPTDWQTLYPDEYYVQMEGRVGWPSIGVRIGSHHNVRLSVETINEMHGRMRTDLARLVFVGNADYIGDTLSLMDELSVKSYQRFSVGYLWGGASFGVGVNLHYYQGNGAFQLSPARFQLYTHDTTLQLDVESDMVLHTTMDTLQMRQAMDEMQQGNMVRAFQTMQSGGQGVGFSIGGRVRLLDILTLSGAWVNVGSIRWNDAHRFSLQGKTTYRGVDIRELMKDSMDIGSIRDSLLAAFDFDTSRTSFSMPTTQRFFVRGNIAFSEVSFVPVGFVIGGEKTDRWRMTYGAYLNMAVLPPLGLTFSASYRDLKVNEAAYHKVRHRKINWGVALHGNIAQLVSYYVAMDNVPLGSIPDMRHADVIFGLSVHLGKRNPYRSMERYLVVRREDVGLDPR